MALNATPVAPTAIVRLLLAVKREERAARMELGATISNSMQGSPERAAAVARLKAAELLSERLEAYAAKGMGGFDNIANIVVTLLTEKV